MKRREMLFTAAALLFTAPLLAQAADPVYAATYLDLRPALTSKGTALVKQYQHDSSADAGNVAANVFQEIGRSNRFVIVETWKDQAAFAAHEKAVYTLGFREQLEAIQNAPYDQRVNHGFSIDPSPQPAGPGTIYVVTHVDVPGAFREQGEMLLKTLVESSRGGSGHVRFDVYQQNDPRTNHFTTFAAWSNRRAFDAYSSTPHALQFREALAPMLGALYDERLYQPIK
jgi:quinol monooxygenase YgiN